MNLETIPSDPDAELRHIRLSICIPTHNGRIDCLREAIQSVMGQLDPELREQLEICVSDNASADGTREMIEQYQREYHGLFTYARNTIDQGLCYNLLRVVEIAHGDYCWYLSSDDQIASGGIRQVLEILKQYPSAAGLAVHIGLYDLHMETEIAKAMFSPYDPDNLRVYRTTDLALERSVLFQGHMSQVIFDRKLWSEVVSVEGIDQLLDFRYFEHVYVIGKMLIKRPMWLSYPRKLIKVRSNNASTVPLHRNSQLEYVLATVIDLSKTLSKLKGKANPTYKIWMLNSYKAFSLSFPPSQIRRYRLNLHHRNWDDFALSLGYARYWYFVPQFWYKTFPAFLWPLVLVQIEIGIRNRLKMRTRLRILRDRLYKAFQELGHMRNGNSNR